MLKENGLIEIYKDSFTGTKIDKLGFDELLKKLVPSDTFIVTKRDRIDRSMTLVTNLINKGKDIKVNMLNIGVKDNTPKQIKTLCI